MSSGFQRTETPRWASQWLLAAGVYNLAWGSLAIAFPHLLFDLAVRWDDRWSLWNWVSDRLI